MNSPSLHGAQPPGGYAQPGAPAGAPVVPRRNDRPEPNWLVIVGALVLSLLAAALAIVQGFSIVLGIGEAFDYYDEIPDPTPTQETYREIFYVLWMSTALSGVLAFTSIVMAIVASAIQSTKMAWWVYGIFAVVLVLCIATWLTGLASVPG